MFLNLDLKDRKLLSELDFNARQSNTQIAKKVGLSKDAIGYRIKQLEKNDVLSGYRTIINLTKLGYIQHRVLLRLIDVNSKSMSEIISFLKSEESVWIVGRNEGEWDLAFAYVSKQAKTFYEFFNGFLSKFRPLIKDKLITELLWYDELERGYLINKRSIGYKKIDLAFEPVEVDALDIAILNLLSHNARMKLIDIAKELNSSSMLILQRIKKLEKQKVIIGYKANINVLALGRDYYGIKVNLSDYREKTQILTEIYSLPEVTASIYSIGGYDIEFDAELVGTKEYHELLNRLRNKFSTIREIRSIRAIEYYIVKQVLR